MSVADEQVSVSAFLELVCKIWEKNDAAELGGLFTVDGSLINPFGERADGQAAVIAMYTDYFGGVLADTSSAVQLENIRSIDDAHVLVDADQKIFGPDGSVVLPVHLTALLRRTDGEWRFVDVRPYALAEVPA